MTTVQDQIVALERKVGPQAASPLFAQLAALYLADGRARDALRVCDSGLAHHPYYSTGHLVKGKALSALKMRAEARREFEYVLELLPGHPAVLDLLRAIPAEEAEAPAPVAEEPIPTPTAFISTPEPTPEPEPEPEPELEPEPEPQPTPEPERPAAVEAVEDEFIPKPYYEEPSSAAEPSSVVEPEAAPTDAFGAPAPDEFVPQPSPEPEAAEDAFGAPTGFAPEPEPRATYEEPPVETPAAADVSEEPTPTVSSDDLSEFGPAADSTPQTVVETPVAPEPAVSPAHGEFDVPPEPALFLEGIPVATPEPAPEAAAPSSSSDFGFSGADILFSGPADEDTFEKYSLRMRAEMSGEGTMTLEDFLNNVEPAPAATPLEPEPTLAPSKDQIEEIAERLQGARKITPIINIAQKTMPTASEQDTPASTGFVTPTLAEIYAKQGWYDDAIKAYRTLSLTKPNDRERFERRIKELEDLKRKNAGL